MKRLSIKNRIAFWYAFSFLIILSVIFIILFAAGNKVVTDEAKSNLTILTDRAVGDVQIVSGQMIIDDDISYYMDHTHVVLCEDDGTVISGIVPEQFPVDTPFAADQIRKVSTDSRQSFYVYDRLIENQKTGKIWVRGMASASLRETAPAMERMLRIFLIALPILCLLIILGGWYITRQAFLPLKRLNQTAGRIQEEGDLSARLGFGDPDSKDEISKTAAVIDQMLERIEESFESEKRFTNDASHELRTPAAVILAECEYALEHLDDPAELKPALEAILSQSGKMRDLIQELLMLARADRGMIQIRRQPIDVSLLAEESAAAMSRSAAEKHIRIRVEAAEGCYIDGDEVLITRVFGNLISNAIKYGKENGTVMIRVRSEEDKIHIRVEDDGIGIPAADLPHIWERFYRVNAVATDDQASMGLGLSLVKWIVMAHEGTITAESTEGKGTSFQICFYKALT